MSTRAVAGAERPRTIKQLWRRLGVSAKFGTVMGSLLALLTLLAVASVGAVILIQRETQDLIVRNAEIERLVLEMDGSLQQARSLTKDLIWRYEDVGYSVAVDAFGRPAEDQIAKVRALATELQERVAEPGITLTWQEHTADLNLYLSAARRYATTVEETTVLIAHRASESPSSPGLVYQLEAHASALGRTLVSFGDESLLAGYRSIRSYEQDYLLAKQRPLMQSAFNAAVQLRQAIEATKEVDASLEDEALEHLDAYLAAADSILEIDAAIDSKVREFDLQADAVDPIGETLRVVADAQVEQARRRFSQNTGIIAACLLMVAALGLAVSVRMVKILDRDVTRNIISLTHTARELQAGDLSARVSMDSDDELGFLAQGMNAMASRLGELIGSLEQQVLERTHDLREQRDFAEGLVNTAQAIILVLDPQGRVVRYNPYMEELSGYALDDTRGKDWFSTFVPATASDGVQDAFARLVKGEPQGTHVNPIVTRDGSERMIAWSNRGLLDRDGHPQGVLAVGQDITERVRVEEALRTSEQNLHVTLDSIGDAVIVADTNGDVVRMNPVAENLTGWAEAEALGQPLARVLEIVNAETRSPVENPVTKVLRMGQVVGLANHTVLISRDGRERQIADSGAPIRGENGRVQGVVLVFRDVTEEERMRVESQRLGRLESIGTLAGGIAHDFNNMLSVILGNTEMALEDVNPDEQIAMHLSEIQAAARRSADLTRQLLAFARRQPITPTVLDLNEAVGGILNMLRRLIGEEITLRWEPKSNLWPIVLDSSQFSQLLTNLCVNARDAISGVGTLSLGTANCVIDETFCARHADATVGDYVRLRVQDDGCGMPPEVVDRIFEPFYTTKGVGEGTGLGLATAYGIVKQNEGFITVESQLGQGTTFSIYLPRADEAESDVADDVAQPVPLGHGEVLLLVEDEASILGMCKRVLQGAGYAVLAAATPMEALELAGEHAGPIDLLITDVIMPEMSGRDLALSIREIRPETECLYMSGYTADVLADHGVMDESVHFIEKPFEARDLIAKVADILAPRASV